MKYIGVPTLKGEPWRHFKRGDASARHAGWLNASLAYRAIASTTV